MRLIPEDFLRQLMGRPGELPAPGNDRWGKSVQLTPNQPSYTVVNVGYLGVVTPWALQLAFSEDDETYTPQVPAGYTGRVLITLLKAVDVKSGGFREQVALSPGDAMPFCTLLAAALTVNVELLDEAAGPLFVHATAAPTETVDCESITKPQNSAWNDVDGLSVPADTVGDFIALPASTQTRQIIIQNNTNVDLLLGFGNFIPGFGPPLRSNMILPGGIHAIYETQSGAFTGAVRGLFASGGDPATYATFTRGISV